MAYKNVPTNTQCVLNGMIQVTEVAAACNKTFTGAAVTFSIVAGVYTLDGVGLATPFAALDQIIIRGSTSAGGVNNDGVYTILTKVSTTTLTVDKPVKAAVSLTSITVDEIDIFILHPTKGHMNWIVYVINSAANSPEISFEPGGYWAAKPEVNAPVVQGQPLLATKNLFQIETARFAQTASEVLIAGPPIINRKGSVLMRIIPTTAVSGATVSVALIQLIGNVRE